MFSWLDPYRRARQLSREAGVLRGGGVFLFEGTRHIDPVQDRALKLPVRE